METVTKNRKHRARSGYYGVDYIDVQVVGSGEWDLDVYFSFGGEVHGIPGVPHGIYLENVTVKAISGKNSNLSVVSVTYPKDGEPRVQVRLSGTTWDLGRSARFFLEFNGVPVLDRFFSRGTFFLGNVTGVDPRPPVVCETETGPGTDIDYMVKDYESFRRMILDKLSLEAPRWKERHAPDLGVALVDLLAYSADYLSYYQDAAATEAYLETARLRTSVQRHTRLLDYRVHDGCNSRLLVQVQVDGDVTLPKSTPLTTRIPGRTQTRITPEFYTDSILFRNFNVDVFETMHDVRLARAHNTMHFYDWGTAGFLLEKGTVTAALDGHYPELRKGDFLIIDGPGGVDEDRHYHPLRLTETPVVTVDMPAEKEITYIAWSRADALDRDWTVTGDYGPDQVFLRGNIVLTDYGRTIPDEALPPVPEEGEYYPRLNFNGLVFADMSFGRTDSSARAALKQNPMDAVPAVLLYESGYGEEAPPARQFPLDLLAAGNREGAAGKTYLKWTPRRDLLNSSPFSRDFIVETENGGGIRLRFGDGYKGKAPLPDKALSVCYRVGGSSDGCMDPGRLAHIVTDDGRITGILNPGASTDYVDAQSLRSARIDSTHAFKTAARCITLEDWKKITEQHEMVKNARLVKHWSGSWHTVHVYIDRVDGAEVDRKFRNEIKAYMEPYVVAGVDFNIRPPFYVGISIGLTVYLEPGMFAGPVRRELTAAFGNSCLADGSRGFFHPANYSFGTPVYSGRVLDRAMQVRGVARVDVEEFSRVDDDTELTEGAPADHIAAGDLEILRLSNTTGDIESGIITFDIIEHK